MRSILMTVIALLLISTLTGAAQSAPMGAERDAEIRKAVTEYVYRKTASLGCEVSIKRLVIINAPSLPAGSLDYEVVAPQQWEGWGNASISVIVRQGSRVIRNLSVRIEVEALAEMVVTVRQIDHGSIIVAGDLAVRKLDLAVVQGRYMGRIEDVIGKKARTTFKANMPLRSDQLEKVPLVKTGQLVTIVAENERMRITVTGKAKSAGSEGDMITVQNLNSLKELPARVIDAGTVQIVY